MNQIRYQLFIDDNLVADFENLDKAKEEARKHCMSDKGVRIESLAAPAPSQTWHYDYEVNSWVAES